jgi:hypothetical protein
MQGPACVNEIGRSRDRTEAVWSGRDLGAGMHERGATRSMDSFFRLDPRGRNCKRSPGTRKQAVQHRDRLGLPSLNV